MNADTAMDIMQEAFLRLWKKLDEGESILNPRAWLLRVARNLAEDHAKSAFRRNGTHPPQTMNGVRAKDPLPLECLEREETFGQLRDVLETLSEADRQILTLRSRDIAARTVCRRRYQKGMPRLMPGWCCSLELLLCWPLHSRSIRG